MLTITQRGTIVPSSPPSTPRLLLAPARARHQVLDGGWWPRSWDPMAELPGLVVALSDRYGTIQNVMLSSRVWDGRFRRLAVGTELVRLGWFATLDAALLIATTRDGEQLELLVVPPSAPASVAEQAMTAAADPTNTMRAADLLAARTDTSSTARGLGPDPDAVWDNEGGSIAPADPSRSEAVLSALHSS